MQTFGEMKSELKSRLQVADSSSVFTDSRLGILLNEGNTWATSIYNWPQNEEAKKTVTQIDHDYYEYPDIFRTDSISRLYVNGKKYDPKNFQDFLTFRENNPTSTDLIYSDYGRRYFIFPTPVAANLVIEVWGQKQAAKLVETTDQTIFSNHDESGNEAILKKAFSIAVKRIDQSLSVGEEKDAMGILAIIFSKIEARQQQYQRIDTPLFDVPDMFARANSPVGGFSIDK